MSVSRHLPGALCLIALAAGCAREPLSPVDDRRSIAAVVERADTCPRVIPAAASIEIPAHQLYVLGWHGEPCPGAEIIGYRWRLDEAPWPRTLQQEPFATVGPFFGNEHHRVDVEAVQSDGLSAFGSYDIWAVAAQFEKDLLVVDDTRLALDQSLPDGTIDAPEGPWPTAAELDTFLYARGGFPWRSYPEGTISPTGLFAGYAYDTIGTRGRSSDQGIPLQTLRQYRCVIWITDAVGATFEGSLLDPLRQITALRAMERPGGSRRLAEYVRSGGRLWLIGAGAAAASLLPWNRPGTPADLFTAADGELVPGRLMFDIAAWRSAIATPRNADRAMLHLPGVLGPFRDPATAPGRGWPGQPSYAGLPSALQPRSPGSDPLPPLRSAADFYSRVIPTEVLIEDNVVIDDSVPHPTRQSALDTLYLAVGSAVGTVPRPLMTYFHATHIPPVVFSGFALWDIRRSQATQVADFVLQSLWGLTRESVAREATYRAARRPWRTP
jgi:hypothetical protein